MGRYIVWEVHHQERNAVDFETYNAAEAAIRYAENENAYDDSRQTYEVFVKPQPNVDDYPAKRFVVKPVVRFNYEAEAIG